MIGRSAFLFLVLANLSLSGVGAVQVRNKVNPIRRVVTHLQEMAKKITEEGEQKTASVGPMRVGPSWLAPRVPPPPPPDEVCAVPECR